MSFHAANSTVVRAKGGAFQTMHLLREEVSGVYNWSPDPVLSLSLQGSARKDTAYAAMAVFCVVSV